MTERLNSRKQKAQQTRERIQTTALDLFSSMGFESVSMEEIARASGCSVGNIYHYFKSKDELALQVTAHVDSAYAKLRGDYRADSERTWREKLLDFVGASLEICVREEVLYKSFIHSIRYPEQGILKTNGERVYFNLLRELIDGCKAEGAIAARHDTEELLEYFLVLHRGMLMQWKICEGEFDIALHGRGMAEYFISGLSDE